MKTKSTWMTWEQASEELTNVSKITKPDRKLQSYYETRLREGRAIWQDEKSRVVKDENGFVIDGVETLRAIVNVKPKQRVQVIVIENAPRDIYWGGIAGTRLTRALKELGYSNAKEISKSVLSPIRSGVDITSGITKTQRVAADQLIEVRCGVRSAMYDSLESLGRVVADACQGAGNISPSTAYQDFFYKMMDLGWTEDQCRTYSQSYITGNISQIIQTQRNIKSQMETKENLDKTVRDER